MLKWLHYCLAICGNKIKSCSPHIELLRENFLVGYQNRADQDVGGEHQPLDDETSDASFDVNHHLASASSASSSWSTSSDGETFRITSFYVM